MTYVSSVFEVMNRMEMCLIYFLECRDLGDMLHGEVHCNDESRSVGTTCHFNCTEPGFHLYPPQNSVLTCLRVGDIINHVTKWDKHKPCCASKMSIYHMFRM